MLALPPLEPNGLQVRLPLEGPGTRGRRLSFPTLLRAVLPLCSALLRSGRDVVLVFEIELQGFRPQSRRSFSKLFEASELRLRRSKLERRKGHANFVIRL